MSKSAAQTKANSRYRAKSVRQVNVPFYPAEQDAYEYLRIKDNKAGYIKSLIRRDIEAAQGNAETLFSTEKTEDDFEKYCIQNSCSLAKPAWPDAFGMRIRQFCYGDDASKGREPLRVVSLFSGAGGLDIGFADAGFELVEAVEIEERFCKSLEANAKWGPYRSNTKVKCIDIHNYTAETAGRIDFIIGGPPCQTFSAAGRRANGVLGTDDERGMLFREYVRVLKELKPKGFLFENVYGIVGAQGGKPWEEIKAAFSEAGYELHSRLLDAADYGVPQHRERLIIVGLRKGTYRFPKPLFGPDSETKRPFYNAGLAISDVRNEGEEIPAQISGKYGHLIPEIPPGLNYSFFTQELGHPAPIFAWRSKFSDFMYKADPSVPTRTIKAQGGQYTGPFHWDNRHFTIAEYKRLQTFPDGYKIEGKRAVAIQQVGNSVPPQLARILALSIRRQVFDRVIPFQIPTLGAEEELGFRKRKRQLTEEYQSKAREALRETAYKVGKLKGVSGAYVYMDPVTFEVGFAGGPKGRNVHALQISSSDELSITVKPKAKNAIMVRIVIKPVRTWALPYKAIVLEWQRNKLEDITVAWKSLELLLSENALKADLVQLSGYYQYKAAINCKMDVSGNGLLKVLASITEGRATRQLVHVSEFAKLLSIGEEEVMATALKLRKLGYEVRNWNTNSQIPRDYWLLPYEFPTFSPMSIQRNKRLEDNENG